MKVRVFIRGDAPEMREALSLVDTIKQASDVETEVLDIDEREGKEVAAVYDIYAVPSFLVVTEDGIPVSQWIGKIPAEFELKNVIYA